MLANHILSNVAINDSQVLVVYNTLLLHADLYVGCCSFPWAFFNLRSTPKEKPLPATYCFSKEGEERHKLELPFKASILCRLHHLCPFLGQIQVIKPHLILSESYLTGGDGLGRVRPHPHQMATSSWLLKKLEMPSTENRYYWRLRDEYFQDNMPFVIPF